MSVGDSCVLGSRAKPCRRPHAPPLPLCWWPRPATTRPTASLPSRCHPYFLHPVSFKAHLFEVYKICKIWGQVGSCCLLPPAAMDVRSALPLKPSVASAVMNFSYFSFSHV